MPRRGTDEQNAGGGESVPLPGPLGRGPGLRHAEHRQQPGRAPSQQLRRQQRQRIQICVSAPQSPVQTARCAVEGPRLHDRHYLSCRHLLVLRDQRAHRLVRGPQRRSAGPGHLDRHHPTPRHTPCERDPARDRGEHRRARLCGKIHPAVASSVGTRRRLPSPYDRRPPGKRPQPVTVRPGLRWGRGRGNRRGRRLFGCRDRRAAQR